GASPFFREFDPRAHGIDLARPPVQLAHALPGRDAVLAEGRPGSMSPGWSRLFGPLARHWDEVAGIALSDQRTVPPPATTTQSVSSSGRCSTPPPAGRYRSGAAEHSRKRWQPRSATPAARSAPAIG